MPNGSGGSDCGHCVFNNACRDVEKWNFDENYCVLRKFVPKEIGYTRCENFCCSEFETRPAILPPIKGPIYVIDYGENGYFQKPLDISEFPSRVKCNSCERCGGIGEKGIKYTISGNEKVFCTMTCFREYTRVDTGHI